MLFKSLIAVRKIHFKAIQMHFGTLHLVRRNQLILRKKEMWLVWQNSVPVWLQTNHKWTGGRGLESSQLHKTCHLREITIPRSYFMMLSSTAFCFPLYLNAMFAPCVPRCVFKADVNYHFADKLYNLNSSYPAIYIYPIVGFLSQLPQGKIWASAILWGLGSI